MIEQIAELFTAAEPVLLVIVGALVTTVSNGMNERRKRRNELMDRRLDARQKVIETKMERFQHLLELRQQCLVVGLGAVTRMNAKVEMQSTASLIGERKIIEATAEFTSDADSGGVELVEEAARRIRELEEGLAAPLPGGWRRMLNRLR
ncbi:hypothetical protein DFP74_5726 [Nocardiopsis sp. Huas11]|uniref:hypothetical protein n=1 Tax=Nocardiopsis sp. Huas11 TaxID=2183912 RepID=UPI000EB2BCAB|nr:hypothetical protein [Nocardiopsis sp. Huas11]RKS09980.1 hypothetical protein DFP74_5726 [Nocardiopsis sp. Huas11]